MHIQPMMYIYMCAICYVMKNERERDIVGILGE